MPHRRHRLGSGRAFSRAVKVSEAPAPDDIGMTTQDEFPTMPGDATGAGSDPWGYFQ
jgi:hypothetical protein